MLKKSLKGVHKVSTVPGEEREGRLKIGGKSQKPIKLETHYAPKMPKQQTGSKPR